MEFNLKAAKRDVKGTGASRRLRQAGTTPGIIYGGDTPVVQISLDHNDLFHALRKEAFHSSMLNIEVDGVAQTAVLRDVQWHPFRQIVLHVDFQRVDATHATHIKVPVHFLNHDVCPGVKLNGGVFSHVINELDLKGLPGKLPAFLEIDMKSMNVGDVIHLSDIKLPEGVELAHATEGSKVIASIAAPRGGAAEPEAGEGEGEAKA